MKDLLVQLAAYSKWANQLMADSMLSLPDAVLKKELPSSFPSLHKTWVHMLFAEQIWWQRILKQDGIDVPVQDDNDNTTSVITALLQQNDNWYRHIVDSSEEKLQEMIHYTRQGVTYQQPRYEIMLHVFNHGTYHRGQLVNLLRQAGIDKIPSTDIIVWMRLSKP